MKVVKKKNKKPLILAILAAVLVLLVAAIIIINAVIKDNQGDGTTGQEPPTVDEALGESIYNNTATAYPHVNRVDIKWIEITGGDENGYGFVWDTDYKNHVLYRINDSGQNEIYFPAILLEFFGDTEYSDFYATEQADGYKMPKLYYLCSGIGTAYFNNKFEISATDEDEREKELAVYGLSKADSPITVNFSYDKDGNAETAEEERHTLTIGNKLIYGQGYYFMVDGRNYVYTTNSTYFGYTMLKYTDYINPFLVAAGLAADNAFEPYLTTDYKQWKNEIYDKPNDPVKDDSTVVVEANVYTPDTEKQNGYSEEENKSLSFDLEQLKKSENNNRLVNILKNQKVSVLSTPIPVTLFTYSNALTFASADEIKPITYKISLVEAVITDGEDITETGTSVGDNNLIKISYEIENEGKKRHGVIDLSSDLISSEVKTALRACKVGESLASPIDMTVNYSETNAKTVNGTMVITAIIGVKVTETGKTVDTVADGTTVTFNYYLIIDGKAQDEIHTTTMEINESLSREDRHIADALIGEQIDLNLDKSVDFKSYYEVVANFTFYEIDEIVCSVVKKPIVSFEYVQASKRDPYYGESFYENTLENEYKLYALNAASCEAVVRVLGGLLESASSSTGLQGTSVIDINITPEKLKKYGLYANTVYFELPRYITTVGSADDADDVQDYLTSLDDYSYYGTLGFTLYISDVDLATGKRYIASDLYDVIAEIDADAAENFIFLDQTFVDFYARRNLVLTDISNISNLKMEFNMSDFFGVHNSRVYHEWGYVYNGKAYRKEDLTSEQLALATKRDFIDVYQSILEEGTETEISKLLPDKSPGAENYPEITLRSFYKEIIEGDSLGTQYFKEFIETLFYTFYEGSFSEEEKTDLATVINEENCLLRMTVSLGEVENYEYDYVYEFYRVSDRRVMVKLYKTDAQTGEMSGDAVSDFYISTFAFKKLVNMYTGLLNKKDINGDIPYVN